jgi:hypothetical protein
MVKISFQGPTNTVSVHGLLVINPAIHKTYMGRNLTSFIAIGKNHVKVGTARIVPLHFGNDTLKIELQRVQFGNCV